MLVLALLVFCMCKIKKRAYGDRYFNAFKIVSSFSIISASLSSILAFVLCFIISIEQALSIGMWAYLAIMGLRTITLVAIEEILYKKNPARDGQVYQSTTQSTSNEYSELAPLNLQNVDTGTKVIKNEKVNDDDDEKMEFM